MLLVLLVLPVLQALPVAAWNLCLMLPDVILGPCWAILLCRPCSLW